MNFPPHFLDLPVQIFVDSIESCGGRCELGRAGDWHFDGPNGSAFIFVDVDNGWILIETVLEVCHVVGLPPDRVFAEAEAIVALLAKKRS